MKYVRTTLGLILWMLLGSLIGILVSTTVSELYRFLNDVLPSVFPSYDIGSGDKLFDTLYTSLWFVSLVITLFITVYLSARYDNFKFELIITKTEGLYKICDFLPTYINIFGKSDLCASMVNGIIYTVPFAFIPMPFIKNESFLAKLAEPYKMMSEGFGYVISPIVMVIIIALCYCATVPLVLKYYRARWFSAFMEA